jgi:flagellar basal body-associated protein FliL
MKKITLVSVAAILVILVVCGVSAFFWYMDAAGSDDAFFESEIRNFEEQDQAAFPEKGAIVFVGSSSIRFWSSLTEDMSPLRVLRRGFGGAHMSHVLYNFDRIVTPYQPKAVVVFVGGNDIGFGKSAQRLISDYQLFIDKLEQVLPDSDLWILAMKPSKARWEAWAEMQKVDEALKIFAEANSKIYFVESGEVLLNAEGKPDDVYIIDGLHLNSEGYRRWTALLKPLLMEKYALN